MKAIKFRQWDVFSGQALGGNPLGIFPDAASLDTDMMQSLTREMNLSECTFISGREQGRYRVRIFTPDREMIFAGHPVVGTAAFIMSELEPDSPEIQLELMRDIVRVQRLHAGREQRFCFDSPPVNWHGSLDDHELAARLCGLSQDQLATGRWPVGLLDVGPTYCIIPVLDRTALEAASYDMAALRELREHCGFDQVTVYCHGGYQSSSMFSTRMFAPLHGVPEDPATGSSACCLAAYLSRTGQLKSPSGFVGLDQGYSMHRPSQIWFSVDEKNGSEEVQIAGEAIEVASGEFRL